MHAVRIEPRSLGDARLVPSPSEMPSRWRTVWPWLFWLCWGAWLAVSDLRSDDIQPAVLMLVLGGAVLGFARPRTWWLWALALAAWIPAEPWVSAATGIEMFAPANIGGWILPPLPALAGGLLGRSIALGVRPAREG